MEKKILKKVNHFFLIREVGSGASGKVYFGYDDSINKIIAIKSIQKSNFQNPDQLQEFLGKVTTFQSLYHPNLLKIFGKEQTKNSYYISLEYANGGDLYELLKYYLENKHTPIPEEIVQKMIRQIASGLQFMHQHKIIHRDIKLENILINFDDKELTKADIFTFKPEIKELSPNDHFTMKIADFGFAKELVDDMGTSTICGTPIIIAPDVIDGKSKKYNSSADLWSLGAITYELIVGEPPFYGESTEEVLYKIHNGTYNFPKNLNISKECIGFINGLLQFDSEKRLNWELINQHPFIVNDYKDFHKLNLGIRNNLEEIQKIEVNSKDVGNYLWLYYEENEVGISLDQIGTNELLNSYFYSTSSEEGIKNSRKRSEDGVNLDDWEVIS